MPIAREPAFCFAILVTERILQRVVHQQANWCRSVFQFCVLTFCKRGITEQEGGAPRPLQHIAYCIVLVQTTVSRGVQALVQGDVIMHREGYIVKMHTVALMQKALDKNPDDAVDAVAEHKIESIARAANCSKLRLSCLKWKKMR